MSRAEKTIAKKQYETLKDIRIRVATGQTTTFAERNYMHIVMKKNAKKKLKVSK
jgi:hypothetical protein